MAGTKGTRLAQSLWSMKPKLSRWILLAALAAGLIWSGLLAYIHLTGSASVLDRFETVFLDLKIAAAGERSPPSDVVIVAIDDQTVNGVGQFPLPRNRLAALIDAIEAAGAKAIAIDLLLPTTSDDSHDLDLGAALKNFPSVIAAVGSLEEALPLENSVPVVETVMVPAAAVSRFSKTGLANIVTDTGGTPRHIPHLFLTPEGLKPSFSLQAFSLFQGEPHSFAANGVRIGEQLRATDLGWHMPLNYYGPGGTIPTFSAANLMEQGSDPEISLEDKLVVLGVTATAVGDRFSTPFDPVMPGVEIQATGLANLLDHSALIRGPETRSLDGLVAVCITLLGLLAIAYFSLAQASFIYFVLMAVWLLFTAVAFTHGHWLNGALPLAASLPPVAALIFVRQISDRRWARQQQIAQQELARFHAPRLAERIAGDPTFLLHPREQTVAVLFIDLSGYTGLSEQLGPAATRDFLKEFHTVVVNVASANNGVVLDFMGDGAMLGFGIPDPASSDPLNACRCTFQLVEQVHDWLALQSSMSERCRLRVGGHIGQAVLSRLGHEQQQQITATGDCVNVASRLLEVAKHHGALVALSSDLIAAAENISPNSLTVPRRETEGIRGRRQSLSVGLWKSHEVLLSSKRL
ncbi:adenylate/guanylate cyclase domain-containing protein [uncultured Roseibium sp.]|uniref:CHASE2 domain-containing protein n=1 Tax=uncultured Roseibium sp. TaxID=1936171 RepID=UPI00262BC3A0|nr:adenylate/guanylate cyclase domain-containing protein [uncultured Roseibium sp.]